MEEKERYEYYLGTNSIKDNKTNQLYGYVVDLLNQQDKELSKLRASYQQVKEENQQLRQQLEAKEKRIHEVENTFNVSSIALADKFKKIKELKLKLAESKEENKKLVKALNGDIFINHKVSMENAKLKQQLKEYSELGTPKEIDDTYRSRNILNNNLQDANRIVDDLVKQLHDLPKKIVEEIREDMSKRIMEKQIKWGGNIQIGFICNAINESLDTILKKYGDSNK